MSSRWSEALTLCAVVGWKGKGKSDGEVPSSPLPRPQPLSEPSRSAPL